MKLRAKVTRKMEYGYCRAFKCVFPPGVTPFMWESILERNLGKRPYSEVSFGDGKGSYTVIYCK